MFWGTSSEEPRMETEVNPVRKACQNTMETEENDRGDKYGKVQEMNSEWGGGGGGAVNVPRGGNSNVRETKLEGYHLYIPVKNM